MRKSRFWLALAAAAAAVPLLLAVPASSSHGLGLGIARSTCPTGPITNPYNIEYRNAVAAKYISFKNSSLYTPAISWSSGRLFYWHSLGCTPHGSPRGYWEDYKNQVLASNDDCTKWEIRLGRSSTGSVTIDVQRTDANGNHYQLLASQHCNSRWKERDTYITKVWASKDIKGRNLVIFNLNHPVSGMYLKVGFPPA